MQNTNWPCLKKFLAFSFGGAGCRPCARLLVRPPALAMADLSDPALAEWAAEVKDDASLTSWCALPWPLTPDLPLPHPPPSQRIHTITAAHAASPPPPPPPATLCAPSPQRSSPLTLPPSLPPAGCCSATPARTRSSAWRRAPARRRSTGSSGGACSRTPRSSSRWCALRWATRSRADPSSCS